LQCSDCLQIRNLFRFQVMLSKVALACAFASVLDGADGARSSRAKQVSNQTSSWSTVKLPGYSRMQRPAFLMYDRDHDDVVVSQFGRQTPLGVINPINGPAHSTISRVPRSMISQAIAARNMEGNWRNMEWNTMGLEWPNKLDKTPAWMGDYVVVPDGFLPPGKTDGGMFLCDRDGVVHRIAEFLSGAFYHEIEWHDFNGDGQEDMLTVRAIKGGSFFRPSFRGEMLWFENPGKAEMLNTWPQHKIVDGPDVIFKSIPFNGGIAVYCTEFFRDDPRMTLRFLNNKGEHQSMRIIDGNMGKPFGMQLVDLDGDGRDELLATNHQGNFRDNDDSVAPAVFIYEIPDDISSGAFPRTIATWDPSPLKDDGVGAGAPGFAYGFHPDMSASASEPKWIAAAGDGCFDVWILKPISGRRFEYEVELIDFGGTTGELLLMDFDNDGITDILVPDNDNFRLGAITFSQGR